MTWPNRCWSFRPTFVLKRRDYYNKNVSQRLEALRSISCAPAWANGDTLGPCSDPFLPLKLDRHLEMLLASLAFN